MNKRKPFWGGGYVKKTKQNEKNLNHNGQHYKYKKCLQTFLNVKIYILLTFIFFVTLSQTSLYKIFG